MFTIADVDSNSENMDMEPDEEGNLPEEQDDVPTYPIRTAITITKVRFTSAPLHCIPCLEINVSFSSTFSQKERPAHSASTPSAKTGSSQSRILRSTLMRR